MYSRDDGSGAIAYNLHYNLDYPEACSFGRGRSIRKRLCANGITAEAMQHAEQDGNQEHLFDFDYKITMRDKRWAEVRGVVHASYIQLFCTGPQADEVVARVNAALYPWMRTERDDERIRRALARKEALTKRWLRRRKMHKPRQKQLAQAANDNKVFIPAPIAAEKKERLTPQFRNTSVSWHEAVCLTISVFKIDRTPLFAARELVEFRLRKSLERNKEKFAQWKEGDFILRFDTFDGVWRGDQTEVMISCTKNKADERYHRARRCTADQFFGRPLQWQKERHSRMAPIDLLGTSAIDLAFAA